MHPPLSLHCQSLRCELLPALGGCVRGLWLGQHEVMRASPPDIQSAWNAASYPLVPYSNRLGFRALEWLGRSYSLAPNYTAEPHNLHGVGWTLPWQVMQSDAGSATLQLQHPGDAAWPFAFDCNQRFTLSADALDMRMTIVNRADHAAPVGLGWHPYFVKDASTQVRFHARSRWEPGPDKLPTHSLPHSGLDTHCAALQVDHCFSGWDGQLQLLQDTLRVKVTSDLPHLVVFTTLARDSIAIEPVSHVNNALGLAAQTATPLEQLGMRVLQPGQAFDAHMRIHIEHTT